MHAGGRVAAEVVAELDFVGACAVDAEAVAEVEAEAISCSDFDALAVRVAEAVAVPVSFCAEAVAVADHVARDVVENVAVEEHVTLFSEEPAGHSDGQPHGKQMAEVHAAEAAPYLPAEHGVGEVVLKGQKLPLGQAVKVMVHATPLATVALFE